METTPDIVPAMGEPGPDPTLGTGYGDTPPRGQVWIGVDHAYSASFGPVAAIYTVTRRVDGKCCYVTQHQAITEVSVEKAAAKIFAAYDAAQEGEGTPIGAAWDDDAGYRKARV